MTNEELLAMAHECLKHHELQEHPFCDSFGCWDVLQAYRAGVEAMRDAVLRASSNIWVVDRKIIDEQADKLLQLKED